MTLSKHFIKLSLPDKMLCQSDCFKISKVQAVASWKLPQKGSIKTTVKQPHQNLMYLEPTGQALQTLLGTTRPGY